MREEPAKTVAETKKRRLKKRWILLCLMLLVLVGIGVLVIWKGPTAGLRWAVRTWDPELRLTTGELRWRGGEIALEHPKLLYRGREEAIFQAQEIVLGLGTNWKKGKFGSLLLDGAIVSLDKRVIAHFQKKLAMGNRGEKGKTWPWEIGRVEVRRGALWLEDFGEPAMDISVNVDGVMEGLGTLDAARVQELDLSSLYVAVHLKEEEAIPLMGAGTAKLRWSIDGLSAGKLEGMRLDEGWLLAGAGMEVLAGTKKADEAKTNDDKQTTSGSEGTFVIGALDLVNLQIHTGKIMTGLPQFSLKVNTALRDVGVGAAAAELAEKIHQVEFADIDILSPRDPLKRAVTVRTVFVKFSLAGIARQEVEELILLGPTIYVGEALFEYMKASENPKEEAPEAVEASAGWKVKKLDVNFGRLVIAVGGRSQMGLPLTFQTQAENLSLSTLAGMNANLILTIPPDDYEFPAYELSFYKVRGDVRLNYPPTEDKSNLVNVIRFDKARWRNFIGTNLWISVTFDLDGINGLFGGEAYRGYVSGGFSFFLQPESPWTGWLSGTKIDLAKLTQDAAPQHFVMSGRADMKLEVNGSGPEIERVLGSVSTTGGGRISVNKLNEMLEAMPPEWNALKREITRVGLETLRDFDYTKANSDFWFVGREGLLRAKMKGPSGSRNIEIVVHGDGTNDGVWSQKENTR